jgi:hypothetical protein
MKATVIEELERGARLTGPEIAAAETKRAELFARFGRFMIDYDFLVLPTTQVPAFDVTKEFVTEIEGVPMQSYIDWMGSCYFITMTGLPAISVPAGFTPQGLPVGLQIVGRHQDDFGVLQMARLFLACEWSDASISHNVRVSVKICAVRPAADVSPGFLWRFAILLRKQTPDLRSAPDRIYAPFRWIFKMEPGDVVAERIPAPIAPGVISTGGRVIKRRRLLTAASGRPDALNPRRTSDGHM